MRQSRGESWKAWALERKGSVQARVAGITALWSGSGGGRQATGLLPALGRARLLISEKPNLSRLRAYEIVNSFMLARRSV